MNFNNYEGAPFSQLHAWGAVTEAGTGRVCNFYQDKEIQFNLFGKPIIEHLVESGYREDDFFSVLDAGGGDGLLTKALIEILIEAGYSNFNVVNIDCGKLLKDAEANKTVAPIEISEHWINQSDDLTTLSSVENDSFDVIVSRMVLQYAVGIHAQVSSQRPTQEAHLSQMKRVLREDGLAIIAYPGSRNEREHEALQLINSSILAQIEVGEGQTQEERFLENLSSRSFTSIDSLKYLAEMIGLEQSEVRTLDEYPFTISDEGYWDRFGKKNGFGLKEVQAITKRAEKKYQDIFRCFGLELERDPQTNALVYPTVYARLRKPVSSKASA